MSQNTRSRLRSDEVKADIRSAAQRLFTSQGFDGVGIREIAAEAQVNPAIVIRHFESKERLFLETIDTGSAWRLILQGPLDDLGRRVVERLLRSRGDGLRAFGATVRASGRPDIHARLRESLTTRVAGALEERLQGPDALLRAHLFTAQLTGLMMALAVYDDPTLLAAETGLIVDLYGRSLQSLLTEPL